MIGGRVRSYSRAPLIFLVNVYVRVTGVVAGIPPNIGGSGTCVAVQGSVIHPLTSLTYIGLNGEPNVSLVTVPPSLRRVQRQADDTTW